MISSTFALPVQTAYCTLRELVIGSSRLLRGSIKPHQLLACNFGVSHQPITQLAHWKMPSWKMPRTDKCPAPIHAN